MQQYFQCHLPCRADAVVEYATLTTARFRMDRFVYVLAFQGRVICT